MEKKEEKKGFWASLFAPKSCDCCCGTQIEEVKEEITPVEEKHVEKPEVNKDKQPTCDCGGSC